MKWNRPKEHSPEEKQKIADSVFPGNPSGNMLAGLLMDREIYSPEDARRFFKPAWNDVHDPFLMKDMDVATDRIIRAIQQGEKIFLYGDYDVDGTTSVSLFSHCFEDWKVEHEIYVPERDKEGYGLSYAGIEKAAKENYSLMIVLDCGTKEHEKVTFARERGIEMIICDHHTPGATHPGSLAFLNPRQNDCKYPYKELSACGVGFKLLSGIVQKAGDTFPGRIEENAEGLFNKYGDLLALSIACDIVPITGENRVFAKLGLAKLKENPVKGIQSLMNLAGTEKKKWDITDLLFFLGPRINAAGRLGSATRAVNILKGKETDLQDLAEELHEVNEQRKTRDKQMTAEALELIKNEDEDQHSHSTVLFNENWHKGVIGIVASRLIEKHFRPTILLTKSGEKWVGSGRSIPEFDLYEALESCSGHLVQFGGHKFAAGLTIKEDELINFKHSFNNFAKTKLENSLLQPILDISGKLDLKEINELLINELSHFEPFGPGNMEPVFWTQNVNVTKDEILKKEHLRLELEQSGTWLSGIGFFMAELWKKPTLKQINIAFQPSLQTWNGKSRVQIKLKDFKKPGEK